MKARNGFVSNSSSSSFIIFVSREVYDQAYGELSWDMKPQYPSSPEGESFLGKDVVSYFYTEQDSYLEEEDIDEDEFVILLKKKAEESGEGFMEVAQ